jgi:hypothetical protein
MQGYCLTSAIDLGIENLILGEVNLHHHHHGHHEDTADNGAHGGGEHPEMEHAGVDVGIQHVVRVLGVDEVQHQLQALHHQAGKEEGGEGDHLQHEQRPHHARADVAGRVAGQAMELARSSQGQDHEHGHHEE